MTPFEKVMVLFKQVEMLFEHVHHTCGYYSGGWERSYVYIGSYVALSRDTAQMLYELFREQADVTCSKAGKTVRVRCPMSKAEKEREYPMEVSAI